MVQHFLDADLRTRFEAIGQQLYALSHPAGDGGRALSEERTRDVIDALGRDGFEFVGRGTGRRVFEIPRELAPPTRVDSLPGGDAELAESFVVKFPHHHPGNDGREQIRSERAIGAAPPHEAIARVALPPVDASERNFWIAFPRADPVADDDVRDEGDDLSRAGYAPDVTIPSNWGYFGGPRLIDYGWTGKG